MEGMSKSGVREFVAEFVKNHPNLPKCKVVAHFHAMGVPKSTIYATIRTIQSRGSVAHMNTGKKCRPVVKMPPQKRRALVKAARHRVGASLRTLARRFKISLSYVKKI